MHGAANVLQRRDVIRVPAQPVKSRKALRNHAPSSAVRTTFLGSGREGYQEPLTNHDMETRKLDHREVFPHGGSITRNRIGFTGQFLIEPKKPKEPTKHRTTVDAAGVPDIPPRRYDLGRSLQI